MESKRKRHSASNRFECIMWIEEGYTKGTGEK